MIEFQCPLFGNVKIKKNNLFFFTEITYIIYTQLYENCRTSIHEVQKKKKKKNP